MVLGAAGIPLGRRRHLFFDLDGTLVDSRPAILNAYRHVFAAVIGRPFEATGDDDVQRLLAMRPAEVFSAAAPGRVEDCLATYGAFYIARCARDVVPYDGARTLLDRLQALDRRVGIVTNKGRERAALDLDNTRLIDIARLTALIGAEHTVERKPHPAPLLAALERSGADAAESIYVGDGPHDMEAARQAGMAAIGASYGYYPAEALRAAGAAALIGRPLDLLDLIERLD